MSDPVKFRHILVHLGSKLAASAVIEILTRWVLLWVTADSRVAYRELAVALRTPRKQSSWWRTPLDPANFGTAAAANTSQWTLVGASKYQETVLADCSTSSRLFTDGLFSFINQGNLESLLSFIKWFILN